MARQLRIEFPGAVYHVTSRGNERRAIFRANSDREAFLNFLAITARRFGWSVMAWVLMTNHYHLVLETPEPNVSRGMQWLNGAYAGWFNRRYNRSGHLFQGRFKSLLIEKEAYFREVLRYVVLNPVRAKIVKRPDAYRWSSYRATAGLEISPQWFDSARVLEAFDQDRAIGEGQYRAFVIAQRDDEHLWNSVMNGIYLGRRDWAIRMRSLVESVPRSTDHPKLQRAIGRPQMAEVVIAVARAAGESAEVIRTSTYAAPLRRLVAWIGWHEGLLTLRSIAASLRLRSEGHISNLIRRCECELGSDTVLLAQLDSALATLRI